jgi:hypothetical protein
VSYEIANQEIQTLLRKLAERLGADMPKGWGFTLLLFEYDPGNSLFYISSAQREHMIRTMAEFIAKHDVSN